MNEHDGILQGHYDAALEQISNLTRERDEARRQLALLLALGKAATEWKHNGDESIYALTIHLGQAVDAALADPVLAQVLREAT